MALRFLKDVGGLHHVISPVLCWRQGGVSDGVLLLSSPCLRDRSKPHKSAFRQQDE